MKRIKLAVAVIGFSFVLSLKPSEALAYVYHWEDEDGCDVETTVSGNTIIDDTFCDDGAEGVRYIECYGSPANCYGY